jgi:predicted RNA-binding protein with PUA-like domain
MAANTWLVKSEPGTYAWDDLVKEGRTRWDGVRNPQARNNLAAMQVDDRVLFYHSGDGKAVVGIARVTRTAYPDPTGGDDRWLAIDLAPEAPLARPVTLAEIKAEASLAKIPLVTQSRLSVQPVPKPAFERIVSLARKAR